MNKPLVSLLIPAFIRDESNLRYLEEALESALGQTYEPLEILVIDDGSPLTTDVKAMVGGKNSPKVRYLTKANGGVADALNLGLKEMRGVFFTWLSHDDLYLPTKVEAQMQEMRRCPEGTILYCDVEHVDSNGGHQFFEHTADLRPEQCRLFFAQYGAHNANSHLIPRKSFESVGGFNVKLRTTQDNGSPGHLKECNELFISFLENLERDLVVKRAGKTPGRYYAECASVRLNRRYYNAFQHAAFLALKELLLHPNLEWGEKNYILGTAFNSIKRSSSQDK